MVIKSKWKKRLWKSILLFLIPQSKKYKFHMWRNQALSLFSLCHSDYWLGADAAGWSDAFAWLQCQHTHPDVKKKRRRLCKAPASLFRFKAPPESRFHLSTLNSKRRSLSVGFSSFAQQTPKIDPVSAGHQEFKYSEDGAMINPAAVHGAVLSSFHLLGGALSLSFIDLYCKHGPQWLDFTTPAMRAYRSAMRAK